MSGKTGEHARLGGISIITFQPIRLGLGTTDADELSATMHGGTHCQDPSIAKSNVVASENSHLHLRLCQRELCAYRTVLCAEFHHRPIHA